jgi:hypothetical protein
VICIDPSQECPQPTGLFLKVASSIQVINIPIREGSVETEKNILLLNFHGGKTLPQFYIILPSVTYLQFQNMCYRKTEEEERIREAGT